MNASKEMGDINADGFDLTNFSYKSSFLVENIVEHLSNPREPVYGITVSFF